MYQCPKSRHQCKLGYKIQSYGLKEERSKTSSHNRKAICLGSLHIYVGNVTGTCNMQHKRTLARSQGLQDVKCWQCFPWGIRRCWLPNIPQICTKTNLNGHSGWRVPSNQSTAGTLYIETREIIRQSARWGICLLILVDIYRIVEIRTRGSSKVHDMWGSILTLRPDECARVLSYPKWTRIRLEMPNPGIQHLTVIYCWTCPQRS